MLAERLDLVTQGLAGAVLAQSAARGTNVTLREMNAGVRREFVSMLLGRSAASSFEEERTSMIREQLEAQASYRIAHGRRTRRSRRR